MDLERIRLRGATQIQKKIARMPGNRAKKLAMTPPARKWVIEKIQELALWTVFVVLAGLFPIWVVYDHKRLTSLSPVSTTQLIIQGELLLVAFAIAADSTSRVMSRVFNSGGKAKRQTWQLLGILASIVFLVMAGCEYTTVIAVGRAMVNPDYVANQSLILFVAALFTGGGLILLD
ncbi:hypothetical protein [Tunturiibacter gelidoferens]|uniref:Heme/copper-type cytochrome/quinol oxidase subunit 3 n=4 Tax=Tunturiibacter TaxID=3154218 RepID=A0A7Y9T2T7_9BACT|nr:hypothetical protein [Edaphobacter lichenicola]NYF49724.1 heme/copper-type cytochrome/quinol oxidase subunit 3 [Edaphobacter lichenicola]